MNSDSVEATLLKILKRSADKGYVQKEDMVKAKAALDKHYAEKFIELLPEDMKPGEDVGVAQALGWNHYRKALKAKIKDWNV